MEALILKYQTLIKACTTLKNIIKEYKKKKNDTTTDETTLIIYRDSLIQRFEFCFDLTWKYLKKYLETVHGLEAKSPKTVIQECARQNIIMQDKVQIFLSMVDDRNMTSHTYDDQTAEEISTRIMLYYKRMHEIINA